MTKLYYNNLDKAESVYSRHLELYKNAILFIPGGIEEIRNQYIWSYSEKEIKLSKIDQLGNENFVVTKKSLNWINESNCNYLFPICNENFEGDIIRMNFQCLDSEIILENPFDYLCIKNSNIGFLEKLIKDMKKMNIIQEEILNRDQFYRK